MGGPGHPAFAVREGKSFGGEESFARRAVQGFYFHPAHSDDEYHWSVTARFPWTTCYCRKRTKRRG